MAVEPALPRAADLTFFNGTNLFVTVLDANTGKTTYVSIALFIQWIVQQASPSFVTTDLVNNFPQVVVHNDQAATERPSGRELVIWKGSVVPDNIEPGDIYSDTAP